MLKFAVFLFVCFICILLLNKMILSPLMYYCWYCIFAFSYIITHFITHLKSFLLTPLWCIHSDFGHILISARIFKCTNQFNRANSLTTTACEIWECLCHFDRTCIISLDFHHLRTHVGLRQHLMLTTTLSHGAHADNASSNLKIRLFYYVWSTP